MSGFEIVAVTLIVAIAMSVIMTVAWIVQQNTGNSGWIDTSWSFGIGLTGVAAALVLPAGEGFHARQILVACFVGVWALRLGIHIARRSTHITDDPRYAALIKGWGQEAPRRMFGFLQIQALVSVPLIMTIFLAAHHPAGGLTLSDGVAIVVMVIAVLGEGFADWQLQRFKLDPANKGGVIQSGLWRFSRHPNYFYETVGWLAYPIIAVDLSGQYPWGWLALAAPITMYWLLVHVSGIPPLEQHMVRSRGEVFRAYQRRTNAFFPGPPRD
ncbi:MAG: DUF1295 domain-containing protein [Pseudolabrys sp.]